MSAEKEETLPEDNAKDAIESGLVEFVRAGQKRRRTARFKAGKEIRLTGTTMTLKETVFIDIEETYEHGCWSRTAFFLGTIRPVPPSRWRRFWAWARRKPLSGLPRAEVLR